MQTKGRGENRSEYKRRGISVKGTEE